MSEVSANKPFFTMEVTVTYTAIFLYIIPSGVDSGVVSLYKNVLIDSTCDIDLTNISSDFTLCIQHLCNNTNKLVGTCSPDFKNDTLKNEMVCKELIFHSPSRVLQKVLVPVVIGCSNVSSAYSEACGTGRFKGQYDPRVAFEETESGVNLFLNKYCALCNGHFFAFGLESNLYCNGQFQLSTLAEVKDVVQFVKNETNCIISHAISDEVILPKCSNISDDLFDLCNSSLTLNDSHNDSQMQEECEFCCRSGVTGNVTYPNVFCCLVSVQDISSQDEDSCLNDSYPKTVDPSLRFVAVLNFFPPSMLTSGTGPRVDTCNNSSVYDGIQSACRPAVCPDFEQLRGGSCISQYLLLQDATFRVKVMFLPNVTIGINGSGHVFAQAVFDRIYTHLTQSFFEENMTLVSITILFRSVNHQDNGYFEVESAILDYYVRPRNMIEISVTERLLLKRDFYRFGVSYEDRFIGFDDTVIYGGDEVDVSLEDGQIRFWGISIDGDMQDNSLTIQMNPTKACPFVEYEESWFKIISNWQILLLNSGVTFNRTQYMVKGLKIRLCSWHLYDIVIKPLMSTPDHEEFERGDETEDEDDDGTAMATAIVQFIGLVCLILTFLTYSLFPELRTLPGKNLMFLVFSMFMAHASFIVGTYYTDKRVVCVVLGIVIHYWWLTAFAWMFVCSFDIFRTLRSVVPIYPQREDTSMHLRYCVFAFVVPFIIVFSTCAINLIQSKGNTVGYSFNQRNTVCFVSTTLEAALTFSLPVTVCILHNIVFLVCACISLKKASTLRRSLQRKDMNFLSQCCKLSTLTGISWVVGFVGTFTQNRYVSLTFVLLSAGQGVFLFLAFVVTRRVFRLYVALLRKMYSVRHRGRGRGRVQTQVRNGEQGSREQVSQSGGRVRRKEEVKSGSRVRFDEQMSGEEVKSEGHVKVHIPSSSR